MPSQNTVSQQPQVQEYSSELSNLDAVVKSLITTGGVLIRNAIPLSELDAIEKDVRPYLDADRPWSGEFFPAETRRVCGLAGKSPAYINTITGNPLYQAVCTRFLQSEHKHWIGNKLESSLSKPQVSNTIVFSIGPGARDQALHRDSGIHHTSYPAIDPENFQMGRETSVGIFVAGKKVTKQNGATRFIPGSHLWDQLDPPNEDLTVYAEMNPGDAFIMLSSCYHGGSANYTADEERLVYSTFMTKGYLRQEENQYLSNNLETIKRYSRETQDLLGYGLGQPFIGWVDLGDPRKGVYGAEWTEVAGKDIL